MVRPTITIGLSLAGVACALTMAYESAPRSWSFASRSSSSTMPASLAVGGCTRAATRCMWGRRIRCGQGEAFVSTGVRSYWLVVQLASVAGGIWAGSRLFDWATS